MYCRRLGIDSIPQFNFYLVFSFFRLAAILQGVKKRALDGNASSEKALLMGSMAKPLAEMAVALI
jgi:aminoglycoside phosphotransferase (APT) family kinase protein